MKISNLRRSPLAYWWQECNIYNIDNTRNKRFITIGTKEISYVRRDLFLISPKKYKEKVLKNVNDVFYKGKNIEEWKCIRLKKLNEVLEELKSKSYNENEKGTTGLFKFEYNKEMDRKYAIEELKYLIKFIENIEFDSSDSASEYICKLYLVLSKADCYSFTRKLNGKLCEVRSFRKKGNVYIRDLNKVLFFPHISIQCGINHFDKAILYENDKETDLGKFAYNLKIRNEHSYSRINNWISDKTIKKYLKG